MSLNSEIIGLDQERFIDPYASYDSKVTSQLLRGVYEFGDAIVTGLEARLIDPRTIEVTKGLALKEFIVLDIKSPNSFNIDDIPGAYPLQDNIYLVVLEYQYQKIKPAPLARLRLISKDLYNANIHLIITIAETESGQFHTLYDSYSDVVNSQTIVYRRIEASLNSQIQNRKLDQNNYPIDDIVVFTDFDEPRIIMPDRSNPTTFYKLEFNHQTVEMDLVQITEFKDKDIFIHTSTAGILITNVHSNQPHIRMYVDNGAISFEVPTTLYSDDIIFKSKYQTINYATPTEKYKIYAGDNVDVVAVDSYFTTNRNLVARENLIIYNPTVESFYKISVDVGDVIHFEIIENIDTQLEAFIFDPTVNKLITIDDQGRLLKVDYTNSETIQTSQDFNSVLITDIASFPQGADLYIEANGKFYKLFYDTGAVQLNVTVETSVTNPVYLNDDIRNLNQSNGVLTIISTDEFFPLPSLTKTVAFHENGNYVKFVSDGSNIVFEEAATVAPGTIVYENGTVLFDDTATGKRYRATYDFNSNQMNIVRDQYVRNPNDHLFDNSSADWLFRVKKDDYRLLNLTNEVISTVSTSLVGRGLEFFSGNSISIYLSPVVLYDTNTEGGLILRSHVDTPVRLKIDDITRDFATEPVVTSLPNDINVISDRDLILKDVSRNNVYYALRTDAIGALVLTRVYVAVDNDVVIEKYVEYQQGSNIYRFEARDGELLLTDLSAFREITIDPSVTIIENPDLTVFGGNAYVGIYSGSDKYRIDMDLSGQMVLTLTANWGTNDIRPPQTGELIIQDAMTGEYNRVNRDDITGDIVLTKVIELTADDVVIKGSVISKNTDYHFQYWVENDTIESVNLNVFNGTLISSRATFYNDAIDIIDQDVSAIGFEDGTGIIRLIKFDDDHNLIVEDTGSSAIGGNIATNGDLVFRDEVTGQYYKVTLNNNDQLEFTWAASVSVDAIIIRNGAIYRDINGSDLRFELSDGNLVVNAVDVLPGTIASERPFETVEIPNDQFLIEFGTEQYWIPVVLDDLTNRTLAAINPAGTGKARITFDPITSKINVQEELATLHPDDFQDQDGIIFKDQVTNKFLKLVYDFTNHRIQFEEVEGIAADQVVVFRGLIFDFGANRYYFRIENGNMIVTEILPA